jgi:hypothetical protein
MDWLSQCGEMTCQWQEKWIKFDHKGSKIKLQGMLQDTSQIQMLEVAVEQVVKWHKGNDVWATALIETVTREVIAHPPAAIQEILDRFSSVFEDPKVLPPHRQFDHAIHTLPEVAPVNSKPYRYAPFQKTEIERQVKEMLAAGLIVPSMSPFASPVLLVKKKDGTWRFCIDYRRLNSVTVKSKFPMPIVDELLDELAGSRFFSKLDLRSGYHQIRMVEADELKTAFKTHHGQFQFRVMPFGLTNAPATFQCLMNSIFAPYIRQFVLFFMDDILVYSKSLEEHLHHLKLVFSLLQQHQLYAKRSKCVFAVQQVEYLGHTISAAGVATDSDKTQVVLQWPTPSTVTELRGFLGLTGYYRKFVQNYSIIAKPLTNLLKKKAFAWTPDSETTFQQLKHALSHTLVLALLDFSLPFFLESVILVLVPF